MRGSNFLNASMMAWPINAESKSVKLLRDMTSSLLMCKKLQMFDHGTERERRHIVQYADQQDGADQQRDEQRTMGRHRAGVHLQAFLGRKGTGDRQYRDDDAEAAEPH